MNITEQYTWLENTAPDSASYKYIIPYISGKRVLDLGCGSGVYLEKFGNNSIGVDASIVNLRRLRSKELPGLRADICRRLPFQEGSFDVVFCSHILEHVSSPFDLLKECRRVLKNDGIIIVTVPIEKSLARLILRDHYYRGHPTHLYSFSMDGMKQLLSLSGFKFCARFVDLPGVRKIHGLWLLDLFQKLPFSFSRRIASNFWVIGEK